MAKKATKPKASANKTTETDTETETTGGALVPMDAAKTRVIGKLTGKKSRQLTYQLVRFPPTATLMVRIVSEVWLSEKLLNAKGEEAKKEPPHMARVVPFVPDDDENLSTDDVVRELIIPAVLKSILERNYIKPVKVKGSHDHNGDAFDDDMAPGYYGRVLLIKSYPVRQAGGYRTFDVVDVTDEINA